VLGGCGFIGSHVVDALLSHGHAVRVFDRQPERFRAAPLGVEYIFGDFSDRAMLIEAISSTDCVFHLISSTFPSTANFNPQADVEGNLVNTLALVQAMMDLNIGRLTFLSSGGTVYGVPETIPIPEDHPLRPINSYGIVKVAIEQYLGMYLRERRLFPVIIRASNPYGPRQGHTGVQGVVSTFLHSVRDHRPIEIWGDGSVVRDFFYVEDLAKLIVVAAESDAVGPFNAGSGKGVSLNQLIDTIASVTQTKVDRIHRPARSTDVPASVLDVSRAEKTFGWLANVDLAGGVAASWDWLLAQAPAKDTPDRPEVRRRKGDAE
jgi:UDP-glucose 4-epimerase